MLSQWLALCLVKDHNLVKQQLGILNWKSNVSYQNGPFSLIRLLVNWLKVAVINISLCFIIFSGTSDVWLTWRCRVERKCDVPGNVTDDIDWQWYFSSSLVWGCCFAGSSILLLPLTVYMERCRKVPTVFIPPSVIFSPLSFLISCFWPSLQRAHKQRLGGSVSPTQRWKYNAAAWATVAAESLQKTRPGSDCVIPCEIDVQILCKCNESISQFQIEDLTSDTLRGFINRKTRLNQDSTETDDLSILRAAHVRAIAEISHSGLKKLIVMTMFNIDCWSIWDFSYLFSAVGPPRWFRLKYLNNIGWITFKPLNLVHTLISPHDKL